MAVTVTNTLALSAVHSLARNQATVETSLKRLSTGFRVNTGKDDPAGLIASEYLRSEIASTNAAIANAQRADQVLATAEGGLSEVSNLLVNLQELVTASANRGALGSDEIDANQLQVDSIIHTIDRLTNGTSFGGRPLLNGGYAYQTSAGSNAAALRGLNIFAARVPAAGQIVNVQVLASAQHGVLLAQTTGGALASAVTLWIGGNNGTTSVSFASGTHTSAVAFSINHYSGATGVVASANANSLAFSTVGYGAAQFVSVQSSAAGFQIQKLGGGGAVQSNGVDARVTINGQLANAAGLAITSHTDAANFSFQLDAAHNTIGTAAQFAITGGGAAFSVAPEIDAASLISIGLPRLGSGDLGFTLVPGQSSAFTLSDLLSGGRANLKSGDIDAAQQVLNGAIKSVATTRGRIGAVRKYDIQSSINALNVKVENLSSAESQIRDADFASETSNLARGQILAQASQFAISAAFENQKIILKLLGS